MRFAAVGCVVLFFLAASASAQMAPMSLFTVTGESTADVQLCQTDGIENCRKIEMHPEALAMEEIDILGNYYKRSHVVDKDDQTMYGYEASRSLLQQK